MRMDGPVIDRCGSRTGLVRGLAVVATLLMAAADVIRGGPPVEYRPPRVLPATSSAQTVSGSAVTVIRSPTSPYFYRSPPTSGDFSHVDSSTSLRLRKEEILRQQQVAERTREQESRRKSLGGIVHADHLDAPSRSHAGAGPSFSSPFGHSRQIILVDVEGPEPAPGTPVDFPPYPLVPAVPPEPKPLEVLPIPPKPQLQPDMLGGPVTAPPVPPAPTEVSVPVSNGIPQGQLDLSMHGDRITLVARDVPVNVVLGLIAQQNGLNIATAQDVTGNVSVTLTEVTLPAALNAILSINGYTWTRQNDIIAVTRLSTESSSLAGSQGREVRTYYLNFLSAVDVATVVQGLLSPVGKAFVIESSPLDKRRTREQLVVEDMPDFLLRIEQYLAGADQPPRQVLIEAHVLQVDLKDQFQHGVNINALLASINGTDITLRTAGFANPADNPAFFLGVDGAHLNLLVEAIQQTTDSKTLASPKVLVVNGQEARIQIGQQLGFRVTTTTQTSTLQQVQFLDVGVVLRVTPQITQDNQILMTVKPEVSTGRINPTTELPEEDTTEVETTIMLGDGRGMIIGGLIQEEDTENQAKIPLVGDLWAIGRLFQKRDVLRRRREIIIALTPRLVPYTPSFAQIQDRELVRATSPLVGPQLQHIDRRPYEPQLSDALWNPRCIDLCRIPHFYHNLHDLYPLPLRYYLPAAEGDGTYTGYFPKDPTVLGGNSDPLPRPQMMSFPPPDFQPPPLPE